jgi:hypothetical protein
MSARNEIAGILEQWLQLTRAEGAAIETAAWDKVRQIQAQKAVLQKALAKAGKPGGVALDEFRATAGRIVSSLERNAKALAVQVRRAQAQQKSLDETKQNLRRIRHSYARPQRHSAWHSYS